MAMKIKNTPGTTLIMISTTHLYYCTAAHFSFSPLLIFRFITSQIPTELSIKVQEATFNVHKVTTNQH